ncbi:MAG: MBOAT family O-acyltransferase, partial [Candidatus Faecousia sp.]|nr:MBOAT family O-acyltransferase [Candidatus Faecousia sp.]
MQLLTRLYAGAYPDLSAFFSVTYLGLFLPLAVIFYGLTPKKWKKYALLLESIGFYWLISGVYIGYLCLSALAIYGFGLWMQNIFARRGKAVKAAERPERKAIKKAYGRRARAVLTVAVAAHIGLILVLKYSGFFMTNVNALFGTGFAIPEYVKPLGLSFFILQSVSYLVDVYRQTIQADRNLARLGLFLGFFPGIVEGPICRYSQTAQALWDAGPIRYENLCFGLQRILFGLMKKLVVADRLNPIVEELFTTSESYPGYMSLLAGILYTVQLYMDFSGSMDAVCGTAQIFGITMPENFKRPFFSKNISEFWTRWHITLGTWFRDYIFYPVTMSGPLKKLTGAARKKLGNHFGPLVAGSIALLAVWFCNGLWHGAAWHYIFFGLWHFVLILLGNIFAPYLKTVNEKLHFGPENKPFRVFQMLRTSFLVV